MVCLCGACRIDGSVLLGGNGCGCTVNISMNESVLIISVKPNLVADSSLSK